MELGRSRQGSQGRGAQGSQAQDRGRAAPLRAVSTRRLTASPVSPNTAHGSLAFMLGYAEIFLRHSQRLACSSSHVLSAQHAIPTLFANPVDSPAPMLKTAGPENPSYKSGQGRNANERGRQSCRNA